MGSLAAAAVGALGSVAGATISGNAAESAAETQAAAADQASAAQLQMFNTIRQDLSPYRAVGAAAVNPLEYGLGIGGSPGGTGIGQGSLVAPFQPTQAQLAATPGYQFSLQQGLEATQNSYGAQGLGGSGAAVKGAANYATGLASTTYQQQFTNYLAQNQQINSLLSNAVGVGQSASNQTGAFGTAATSASNNFLTSGAAASAAGTVGAANAASGGFSGLSSAALLYSLGNSGMFQKLLGYGQTDSVMANNLLDNVS